MSCPDELDPTSRLSPRARQIRDEALALLEAEGWSALTMRSLAGRLGIKAPALYKHFPHKDALASDLIAGGLVLVGERLHDVVDNGGGVADLVAAYRDLATARPHLYRLATTGRLDRAALPPGLEEWAGSPFFEVIGDPFLAQAFWAATHGMTVLEIDGRFPTGRAPEESWRALVDAFERS